RIWRSLTGGSALEAVKVVDTARLAAAAAALADRHDRAPRNAGLDYIVRANTPVPQLKQAREGLRLRHRDAAEALSRAFLAPNPTVDLPVDRIAATITDDEAQQVKTEFAQPAISSPVTVKVGEAGQFPIPPTVIAQAVSFVERDGALMPNLKPKTLRTATDELLNELNLDKPRDASVRIDNGRPVVVPARNGTDLSADTLAQAVQPALTKPSAERVVSVQLSGAEADFSTQDAENLGITTVTGQFTTRFPYAEYRNVNIGRAAELINGTVLKPGQTFSLNNIVGERTKANGFTEGNVITGGKFRLELGGGVSQSATTTYNAMFFAGLKDVEHRPHTLYINRYPPGREATVAWPTVDLKFQNDTRYGVLVEAKRVKATPGKQGSITVRMWSTKTYDKIESSRLRKSNFTTGRDLSDPSPECQPMSPVQGFDVDYSRLFYRGGEMVKKQDFFWRYQPTDRVRCT
ncbi:MAG TPA: VanW family protein, partial [Propionibacteriaceae bacterium]